jgi:glyoxylase-like metal-dependent hydrolase (beta-lactamase superfamily II)
MTAQHIRLGRYDVFGLREGYFMLDGGAMFGVVPKTLWEKHCPADAQNRIRLGLNSLVVRTADAVVLVETGIGTKMGQKLSGIYCVQTEPGLRASLEEAGFKPEDVDLVINTHLHFDHCGGNTRLDESGRLVPTFPKARYIIQRGEWDAARNPNEREKSSYLPENFLPLEEAGVLELVDGDREIAPGVEVIVSPGHTRRHQSVRVRSQGQTLFFLGDLVPTAAHTGIAYIMSYDLYPLETLETRRTLYEQAIAEDWLLAFVHDPVHFFGKVRRRNSRYEFARVEAQS